MSKNILLPNMKAITILVKINKLNLNENGYYVLKGSIVDKKSRNKIKQIYNKINLEKKYEKWIDNLIILLPIINGSITTDIYDKNSNRLSINVLEEDIIIKTKIYLTNIKIENDIIIFIWISTIILTFKKYQIISSSDEDELIYI